MNGFNGTAAKVQTALSDPMSGHVLPIFRAAAAVELTAVVPPVTELCLLTKRLERGRFAWRPARDSKVFLTPRRSWRAAGRYRRHDNP